MSRLARVLLAGAVLVSAGCVGSVDREEFEAEIQERGGGISQDLAIEAVQALERELGTDEVEVLSMTISNEHVVAQVRSPEFPDDFDSYTFRGGDLSGPEPVSNPGGAEDPSQLVFDPHDIELDELNDMVDQALEEADQRDGYAETVVISRAGGGPPVISVSVTNDRQTESVNFGPDGALIGVQ